MAPFKKCHNLGKIAKEAYSMLKLAFSKEAISKFTNRVGSVNAAVH